VNYFTLEAHVLLQFEHRKILIILILVIIIMDEILIKVDFLENLARDDIDLKSHSTDRMKKRQIKVKWIYHCLISEKLMGILKQRSYRFRLYYLHPEKPHKYDLIIVVDIFHDLAKFINVVTTYEEEIERRVR
jgi:hypothetical protein